MKKLKGKLISATHTIPILSRKGSNRFINWESQSKFEEFVKIDMKKGVSSAEYDLNMESRLGKKLKVKDGNLLGTCDGLNSLFFDNDEFVEGEEICERYDGEEPIQCKKRKFRAKSDNKEAKVSKVEKAVSSEGNAKYKAPHLRSHLEDSLHTQTRRRVRGLLNNLSKANVQLFTTEMSYIVKSIGSSAGTQIIMDEVLTAYSRGVQCHEQFASLTAGMTCSIGISFGANLLANCAIHFEEMYTKEDTLALRNLALFFAHLFIYGVFSSDLMYDFLVMLCKNLAEVDVSVILTILLCCGMKLRSENPSAMKDFITIVQSRVNELKTSEGGENLINKKMEFMLKIIYDIKNNTKNVEKELVQDTQIKKWLEKLNREEVKISGMTWNKLIDPEKSGQWWLSGDGLSPSDGLEDITKVMDGEITELEKMKKLAAEQRMNTGAREAIFCVIMSGEDYADTVKNLLRLNFSGKQDREIMRVLVECCLQEKVFNKYYTVLAKKLCELNKNHKFSLQYCIWDHYKQLESMELGRSMCLARFVSEMLTSFTLSASLLKAAGLDHTTRMTPRRVMHFRMLFDALFDLPSNSLWNVFTRLAATPSLSDLRSRIELFLSTSLSTPGSATEPKCRAVKSALANSDGLLM